LLVIGLVLSIVLYGGSSLKEILSELLGENLFQAGLIPFLTIGYKLVIAQYNKELTAFKDANTKKLATSLGLIIIGGIILFVEFNGTEFGILVGSTFMLTGLMYVIERLFFSQEDTEREAQRAMDEVEELRRTLSVGLATGYFYSFVKPFCEDLYKHSDCPGDGEDEDNIRIPMDFGGRGNVEERMLCGSKTLNILIPRDLDTGDLKGTYNGSKTVKVGGLTKGHYSTPWSMKLPFLKTWESDDGEEKFCTWMCDVPNTMTALYHRKKDVESKTGDDVEPFNMIFEIRTFANTLIDLVHDSKECFNLVRILSIPAVDKKGKINWDDVRDAVAVIEKDPSKIQ